MKTILVVMALTGRVGEPQYVVEFKTEKECLERVAKEKSPSAFSRHTLVCVPKIVAETAK